MNNIAYTSKIKITYIMYSFLYFTVFVNYLYHKIQPEVFKTNEKVFKLVKQFYICWFILHNEDAVNILSKMIGFTDPLAVQWENKI